MRIKCSHCSGTFSLPEDRVAGKSGPVKVKCPSCSKVLQIKLPEPKPDEPKEWYYSKGQAQEGPFSFTELGAKVGAGLVTAEELVWKAGFDDWKFAEEVPEIKALLDGGEALAIGEASEDEPPKAAAPDSDYLRRSRAVLEELAQEDARKDSKPEPQKPETSGGLFDGFGGDDDEDRSDADAKSMLHQRHDTSVLFSMDDLFGGDKPEAPAKVEKKDDSGLIDIRKMAIGAQEEEKDLFGAYGKDSDGSESVGMQGPVVIPIVRRRRKTPWVVAAGLVVIAGAAGAAVLALNQAGSAGLFVNTYLPSARAEAKSDTGEKLQALREQHDQRKEEVEKGLRAELDALRQGNDQVFMAAMRDRDDKLSQREKYWNDRISGLEAELAKVTAATAAKAALAAQVPLKNGRPVEAAPPVVKAEDKSPEALRKEEKDRRTARDERKKDEARRKDEGAKKQAAAESAIPEDKPQVAQDKPKNEKVQAADLLKMIDKKPEAGGDEGGGDEGGVKKKTLTMSDITREVKRKRGEMQECFAKYGSGLSSARISTRISIENSGKVTAVEIASREFAGTALGNCVKKIQLGMEFPPFSGAPLKKPISVLLP